MNHPILCEILRLHLVKRDLQKTAPHNPSYGVINGGFGWIKRTLDTERQGYRTTILNLLARVDLSREYIIQG